MASFCFSASPHCCGFFLFLLPSSFLSFSIERGDSGALTLLRHKQPLFAATNCSSGDFQLLPAADVQPSSPSFILLTSSFVSTHCFASSGQFQQIELHCIWFSWCRGKDQTVVGRYTPSSFLPFHFIFFLQAEASTSS